MHCHCIAEREAGHDKAVTQISNCLIGALQEFLVAEVTLRASKLRSVIVECAAVKEVYGENVVLVESQSFGGIKHVLTDT
jgi:hypothetical protein